MRRFLKILLLSIHPCVYFVLAVAILTVPVSWVTAWIMASLVHELGHYSVIRLCRKCIYSFKVNWNGMILETEDLGNSQWLCALAGPVFGFFLVSLSRWFPRLAVCALVQSGFNLLPIYPADGGRIFSGLLSLWLPPKTVARMTAAVSMSIIIGLIAMVLYLVIRYTVSLFLLIFLVVLFVKLVETITSCKAVRLLVQ